MKKIVHFYQECKYAVVVNIKRLRFVIKDYILTFFIFCLLFLAVAVVTVVFWAPSQTSKTITFSKWKTFAWKETVLNNLQASDKSEEMNKIDQLLQKISNTLYQQKREFEINSITINKPYDDGKKQTYILNLYDYTVDGNGAVLSYYKTQRAPHTIRLFFENNLLKKADVFYKEITWEQFQYDSKGEVYLVKGKNRVKVDSSKIKAFLPQNKKGGILLFPSNKRNKLIQFQYDGRIWNQL